MVHRREGEAGLNNREFHELGELMASMGGKRPKCQLLQCIENTGDAAGFLNQIPYWHQRK